MTVFWIVFLPGACALYLFFLLVILAARGSRRPQYQQQRDHAGSVLPDRTEGLI